MVYTAHGHHIPDTVASSVGDAPKNPARCGGVHGCPKCMEEWQSYTAMMVGEDIDYINKAKQMVQDYVDSTFAQHNPGAVRLEYGIYVERFDKVLQNWKANLGTTMPDGMFYQITYDGNKKCAYFDAYKKTENFTIWDATGPER